MKHAFAILLTALAFGCSAGQINPAETPTLSAVTIEGDILVDPDFGYSLRIPTGFERGESADSMIAEARGERITSLVNPSDGSSLSIACAPTRFNTKQEAVTAHRRSVESMVMESTKRRGRESDFDLAFDRYQQLSDLNISADSLDGKKVLIYLFVYDFKGSLHDLQLLLTTPLANFDSCLPTFYSCVKSINLPDRVPKFEGQGQKEPASVRLEKLKKLKDGGLISEQEYENKKRQILNEL